MAGSICKLQYFMFFQIGFDKMKLFYYFSYERKLLKRIAISRTFVLGCYLMRCV